MAFDGRPELFLASFPRRGHCRPDAAAGSVDLLVASPRGAQLELGCPVPEEGRVRVAVDKTGQRHLATPVHALELGAPRNLPQHLIRWANRDYPLPGYGYRGGGVDA